MSSNIYPFESVPTLIVLLVVLCIRIQSIPFRSSKKINGSFFQVHSINGCLLLISLAGCGGGHAGGHDSRGRITSCPCWHPYKVGISSLGWHDS